ncbi:MAG: KH domain-containing protein [Spirochaetaceae bacterium]|jgi:predicted RNA-binding protein YlqC (UPF0109 family)|nr:KH domain-containing protein [Spirochaetaceae bacterium]
MEIEFIEFLAKSLVSNPDKVQVSQRQGENGMVVQLSVDAGDVGRVIGKQGRIARAMRTLLNAVNTHDGMRYSLEIVD